MSGAWGTKGGKRKSITTPPASGIGAKRKGYYAHIHSSTTMQQSRGNTKYTHTPVKPYSFPLKQKHRKTETHTNESQKMNLTINHTLSLENFSRNFGKIQ